MSLEARLQTVAREEAGSQVAGLQEQITDLHEHLHVAMTRIAKLEASAGDGAAPHPEPDEAPAPPPARRTTKKASSG
ncbi:hypothetical protein [Streptomyces iconiensis]|uniref:Uncharacterized protein n=1 Tax=Streptomyces iconiensis TaxID=1384038 RepID=A0ABT7AAU2_9ACTN|nr:hypothetical protein [Streptomyces iconiensis]MDJ1137936.1 hypothetical protein [Streptomyces iconiensis]